MHDNHNRSCIGARAPGLRRWALLPVFLLAFQSLFAADVGPGNVDSVLALLDDMEAAWSRISDCTKRIEKTERLVNGDVTRQSILIKYRRPGHFYMRVLEGKNKGSELIYPSRAGSTMAVAHAGGFRGGFARFLAKTVILRRVVPTEFALDDPLIVKGQHQNVLDTSFGATIAVISGNLRMAARRHEGRIGLQEDCSAPQACLLRIDFDLPAEAGQMHAVEDGETLWTIASAYDQSMYAIWYNNPRIRGPDKVQPGQTVFIPRYYAARGIIWIDADSLMPARLEMFDAEDRLYERYVYSEIQTNVGLTDIDFDPGNPEYRF